MFSGPLKRATNYWVVCFLWEADTTRFTMPQRLKAICITKYNFPERATKNSLRVSTQTSQRTLSHIPPEGPAHHRHAEASLSRRQVPPCFATRTFYPARLQWHVESRAVSRAWTARTTKSNVSQNGWFPSVLSALWADAADDAVDRGMHNSRWFLRMLFFYRAKK